eukprot:scaffold41963_cov67-Attheya_sp.AAC.4
MSSIILVGPDWPHFAPISNPNPRSEQDAGAPPKYTSNFYGLGSGLSMISATSHTILNNPSAAKTVVTPHVVR